MQGITFTIQNPDSKPTANAPVIYYDKPKVSNLTFLLTQNLGIKQLSKGDTVTIHFPASLLQSISTDNVLSKGWEVKTEQPSPSNQNQYSITLSATGSVNFGKSELAISLQMLQGKSKTNGDVTLRVNIQGAGVPMVNSSVKLFVLGYPDQPKELDDNTLVPSVTFNDDQAAITDYVHLFLSKSALQPPIANRLKLNLKYSGDQLVEKWEPNERPFFNISFSYGSSSNDLTDKIAAGADGYNTLTSAYNIVASSGEDDRWQVLPEGGTNTTIWKVVPTTSNHHLFTEENDNLDIVLKHIISRLPEGNATIYIQWGNIPGYNDGWKARNIIKKKPAPRITAFTGPKGAIEYSIKYRAGISLKWDVFAAPKVQLRCKEAPYLNQSFNCLLKGVAPALVYCGGVASKALNAKKSCGSLIVKSLVSYEPESNFYLQALDEEGKPVGDEVGPVTVTIDDYPMPAFKGALHVKEAITPFTNTSGEPTFYISLVNTTFTLQWQVEDPNVVETITIVGPTGKTVKTIDDPTATQVRVPYRQDGIYQIILNKKNSGHPVTERFVVNQLFSAKKLFMADGNTNITIDATLEGRIPIEIGEVKVDVWVTPNRELSVDYRLYLSFLQNKRGELSLDVTHNQLTTPKVPFKISDVHFSAEVTFPQPSILPSELIPHSFTWNMHPDGNIAIQFKEAAFSKEKWTLQLRKGSTPENLAYQLTLEGDGDGADMLWLLPVNPPRKTVVANYILSGDLSAEGLVIIEVSPPISQQQLTVPISNFVLK